jgi:hypothetical protein
LVVLFSFFLSPFPPRPILVCFKRNPMPELSTIYDYLRANALLLGTGILEQFPALHQVHGPLSPRIEGFLRKPFPAQAIAIMGWRISKRRLFRDIG